MTPPHPHEPQALHPAPEPHAAPASAGLPDIDDATVEAFRRDGVVHLPGVFADWVDVLRAGVERNMASPGPYTREYEPEGSDGYFFGDYCNWARIPEYREFVLRSGAAALAARLMDSSTARFFHEHVLVKEPRTESRTPWHHDLPYYCIDGTQTVSFWTPLDAVPREVCLELVAGSHRWGKSFLPRKFVGVDYERKGEDLDTIPDIDARRDEFEIASFDMAPGDAIAFHFLTVHGAPGNASASTRRRAFAHRWVGDDVRFKVRGGEVSPPFPEVHQRLRDGDALDDPEFPLVWATAGQTAPMLGEHPEE
ncbi:MAG: phytanoyl-CoA dioxygenase family protein [Thiotrichales bacterium]|nr:phytanoyl-CoA dioxygenase family protein [Thiotrichales bacterium]